MTAPIANTTSSFFMTFLPVRAYLGPVREHQKASREPSRVAFDMNCR
jgi:hypothetical protein